MNSNRMNQVVAGVVAWHNRHPLARRIRSAQVNSVGVVALPFVTTGGHAGDPLRADLIAPRMVMEPSFSPPTLDKVVPPDEIGAPASDAPEPKTSLRERAVAMASAAQSSAPAPEPPQAKTEPARFDLGRLLRRVLRLLWPGSRTGFQSVFSEDFIAPLSPQKVARWALRHGSAVRPGEPHWPQRQVPADPALQDRAMATPGVEPVTLYLVAAIIDTPRGKLRVLLGRSGNTGVPHVLGRRDLSTVRKIAAGLIATLALALAAWAYLHEPVAPDSSEDAPEHAEAVSQTPSGPAPTLTMSQIDAQPASAVSAPKSARVSKAAPASAAASSAVRSAKPALQPASSTAALARPMVAMGASKPTPAAPGSAPLPGRSPSDGSKTINEASAALHKKSWIPESDKQAALAEGRRLRGETAEAGAQPRAGASVGSSAPLADNKQVRPEKSAEKTAAALPPEPAASAASAATGPRFYALATASSPSKLEAEARMILLRAGAANAIAPHGTRIELLQSNKHWQAVWWPFKKREDAERARRLLAVRGVKVELVEF